MAAAQDEGASSPTASSPTVAPMRPPTTCATESTKPRRHGWYFLDADGKWAPYSRKLSREIEEMYDYGAPHCLYRPHQLGLCEDGCHQPDAMQGLMLGERPPSGVCTHLVLFDRMVDVDVYAGTVVQIRRQGPLSTDRQEAINSCARQ